jgi:hypothetical protein
LVGGGVNSSSGAIFRLATFLGCWVLASWLVAARAGEARVFEGNGPSHVVIETNDASADEVLAVLASHFQFAVERSARPAQPVRYSGRLEGSLDQLLERLLRHEGHMIVRSAEARAGISRILIIEAKGETPTSTVGGVLAALKARLQLSQPAQGRDEPGK